MVNTFSSSMSGSVLILISHLSPAFGLSLKRWIPGNSILRLFRLPLLHLLAFPVANGRAEPYSWSFVGSLFSPLSPACFVIF